MALPSGVVVPAVLAAMVADTSGDEGRVNHLYLDTAGKVTVGVGHELLVPQAALLLPFLPLDSVQDDFRKVACATPGMLPRHYAALCRSRLSEPAIDALLSKDILLRLALLAHRFPSYSLWPSTAQRATLNMVYNLGMGGVAKFPLLCAALDAKDFATAAKQCVRQGVARERNLRTIQFYLTAERDKV